MHSHPPSPPSPFLRGTYFGSTSSVPKMDSSRSTLRIMARGIHRTVLPTGLRPHLPIHRLRRDRYSPASSSCLAVACRRRWCNNYAGGDATALKGSTHFYALTLFNYNHKYGQVFLGSVKG